MSPYPCLAYKVNQTFNWHPCRGNMQPITKWISTAATLFRCDVCGRTALR